MYIPIEATVPPVDVVVAARHQQRVVQRRREHSVVGRGTAAPLDAIDVAAPLRLDLAQARVDVPIRQLGVEVAPRPIEVDHR